MSAFSGNSSAGGESDSYSNYNNSDAPDDTSPKSSSIDRKLKWSIATYARLKPRTEEDEELRFIPYTIHPRDETPPLGKKRASARAHRPLELGAAPSFLFHEPSPGLNGEEGDEDWENDSGFVGRQANKLLWGFDEVFGPDSSQEEVYETAVHRLVLGVLDGYNGTLFAYGQTGSGKTYTVQGGDGYVERGLIPRTVQSIFDEIDARVQKSQKRKQQEKQERQASSTSYESSRSNGNDEGRIRSPRGREGHKQSQKGNSRNVNQDDEPQYLVSVSYCQIYNEAVYDLLDTSETRNGPIESWPKIELQEDGDGALHLKGLRTYRARDAEEALRMYFLGATNRITSATPMNVASSRSHAVFTINVECGLKTTFAEGEPTRGKIHMVDLAGSERVYKSVHEGDDEFDLIQRPHYVTHDKKTRMEGRRINLSLHYLEQVIVSLQEASSSERRGYGTRHIPYRNSVLTSYLRDSLGGNCRTTFVVTLSLASVNLDETVSTCRFAHRCAQLQVDIEKNRPMSTDYQLEKLREQNQQLKANLQERDSEVAELQAHLRESVESIVRLRRRLRSHTRNKLSATDTALCRTLVDSYLRHDPDSEAAIHGEANPDSELGAIREVVLDDNLDAKNGVDLPKLPDPFPESLANLMSIMKQHRYTCDVLVRRDEELADAAILREVARLLRAHAEYAAEMAATARDEIAALRGEGNKRTKVGQQGQKTPASRIKQTPSRMSITSTFAKENTPRTVHGEGYGSEGDDSELDTRSPQKLSQHSAGIIDSGRTDSLAILVTKLMSDKRVVGCETIRRISSNLDRVAMSLPHASLAAMLVAGGMFIKHGRRGRPRARWLWLSADLSSLLWRRRGEQKVRGELPLLQFNSVQLGRASHSSATNALFGATGVGRDNPSDDDAFFSLIGSEKRLSLQVEVGNATVTCKRARDTWARAFAHILGAIHIIGLNND